MRYLLILLVLLTSCTQQSEYKKRHSSDYKMNCEVVDGDLNRITRRCENKEVVCYTAGGGISCMPKELIENRD